MLQRTWNLLARKYGADNLFVSAGGSQEKLLRDQLGPDAQLILEPSQRDTFAAIALATAYLVTEGVHPNETIVVLPVDAYADEYFYDKLADLNDTIQNDQAKIALIGIQPTFPAEKYGYIIPGNIEPYGFQVEGFYEKPDSIQAAELIDRGALWNCGVFAFRLTYLQQVLSRYQLPSEYKPLASVYDTVPRISFDYMIVEPEKNLKCVKFDGSWTDLGTWTELIRMLEPARGYNVVCDDLSEDCYVINHLAIPIVVAGISNAFIVAGPEGILISDRHVTDKIKPLVEQLTPKSQVM